MTSTEPRTSFSSSVSSGRLNVALRIFLIPLLKSGI